MKNLILFIVVLFTSVNIIAQQNVGIGTIKPNESAVLDIYSNTKGLLIPRTSTLSRYAITNPAKGLMVYDTTHSAFFYYDGGTWRPVYEQNYDSATVNYYNVDGASVNMSTSTNGTGTSVSGSSGFIYDNGGPAGNYLANSYAHRQINFDDSTFQIKITVEEMNAEVFYDSLFILQYNGTAYTDTIATFTGTQTGTIIANNSVRIYFKANALNHLAGFKIRWGKLRSSGALQTATLLYGWYFNNAKIAAMGGTQQMNNWYKDSVGFGSISYGIGNKAKGDASIAMGQRSNAIGLNSIALGRECTASGNRSIAIGKSNALNDFATAIGYGTATGYASTALGYTSTATGLYSIAMGLNSYAAGQESVAIGGRAEAIGNGSIAIGSNKTLGSFSTAMGVRNYATGFATTVLGINNDSIVTRQIAITPTTPLFIVGNGDNSYPDISNALVVLKNGNVAIGNNGSPASRLHITGGRDAGLGDIAGYLTIGEIDNTNMVFDQNEIQVRNNAAAANMYLQKYGANVMIGSPVNGSGVTIGPDQRLAVNGGASKTGSTSWSIWSDMRLKQNIEPYTEGLSSLLKIKPVWYQYNAASGFDAETKFVGVLAQQLQQISPYMISESKNNKAPDGSGYLSVDNGAMTYMLINAVKEQQQMIQQQKEEIRIMQKEIQLLKSK